MDVLLLPTVGTTYKIAEMLADPIALNTRLGAATRDAEDITAFGGWRAWLARATSTA
jgi:hypothetical protein